MDSDWYDQSNLATAWQWWPIKIVSSLQEDLILHWISMESKLLLEWTDYTELVCSPLWAGDKSSKKPKAIILSDKWWPFSELAAVLFIAEHACSYTCIRMCMGRCVCVCMCSCPGFCVTYQSEINVPKQRIWVLCALPIFCVTNTSLHSPVS